MKGTKPYWYPDTACSIVPYFICGHFPNLVTGKQTIRKKRGKPKEISTHRCNHLRIDTGGLGVIHGTCI